MSESKIELNARKIRNGIRKELAVQKEKMWDKLSTEYSPPPFTVTFKMGPYDARIRTKSSPRTPTPKKSWDEVDLKGDSFYSASYDEVAKDDE